MLLDEDEIKDDEEEDEENKSEKGTGTYQTTHS